MSTLSASVMEIKLKLNQLCWWQSQTEVFQQSRECNSKVNDPTWPVFKLIRDSIHVNLICKFQRNQIKTSRVILTTMSHRGFFSNQGNVALRLTTSFGQFLNLSETLYMSIWNASFRNIWLNLKVLWWWQAYFFHCKSMGTCGCHINQCPVVQN